MPILNEKVFASKCTISESAPPAVPAKDRPAGPEPVRAKEDSKDKESSANSSNKTSKNNSTDSESAPAGNQTQSAPPPPPPPPPPPEDSASVYGNSSINLNKSTLSQAKPALNYPTSIQHQQSTSSSSSQLQTPPPLSSSSISSKFSGTPVPNRVFVGGISTDVRLTLDQPVID